MDGYVDGNNVLSSPMGATCLRDIPTLDRTRWVSGDIGIAGRMIRCSLFGPAETYT